MSTPLPFRQAGLAIAALVGSCFAAAPASAASIWTEVPSGTTQNITAIEYQSASRFWFTTAAGAIFKRQADGSFAAGAGRRRRAAQRHRVQLGRPGLRGRQGRPGAALDQQRRQLDPDHRDQGLLRDEHVRRLQGHGHRPGRRELRPLRERHARVAVRRGLADRHLAAAQPGAGRRSAGAWTDGNRDTKGTAGNLDDDTCKINPSYSEGIADAFWATPDVGYIVASSYSEVFFTTNNLATAAAKQARRRRQRGRRRPRDRRRPDQPEPHVVRQRAALRPLDDRLHARRLADRRLVRDRQRHRAGVPGHRAGRHRLLRRHRPRRRRPRASCSTRPTA